MAMEQIAIYGAGDFGQEIAWLIQECRNGGASYEAVCFIDDDEAKQSKLLNSVPVMALADASRAFPDARVVGAVGDPRIRESMTGKAAAAGFGFATLVHPRVERSRLVDIGEGTVILPGTTLTTNIVLGRHVLINPGCTLGHDAVLGDFATLSPGVHISGRVHLGRRVFVGTGASTVHGTKDTPLVIGDDAVVGAGACVTKSVPAGETVVGVPARPIETRDQSQMAEARPSPSRVGLPVS
jgi:sugar O-acyltransferase (sialic acid O-acetyltransferase NeuD family)